MSLPAAVRVLFVPAGLALAAAGFRAVQETHAQRVAELEHLDAAIHARRAYLESDDLDQPAGWCPADIATESRARRDAAPGRGRRVVKRAAVGAAVVGFGVLAFRAYRTARDSGLLDELRAIAASFAPVDVDDDQADRDVWTPEQRAAAGPVAGGADRDLLDVDDAARAGLAALYPTVYGPPERPRASVAICLNPDCTNPECPAVHTVPQQFQPAGVPDVVDVDQLHHAEPVDGPAVDVDQADGPAGGQRCPWCQTTEPWAQVGQPRPSTRAKRQAFHTLHQNDCLSRPSAAVVRR